MPRLITQTNDYKSTLLKLIPSEVIATYMCIDGVIPRVGVQVEFANIVSIVSTVVIVGLIYPLLTRVHGITDRKQVWATMIGFLLWVFWLQIDNPRG